MTAIYTAKNSDRVPADLDLKKLQISLKKIVNIQLQSQSNQDYGAVDSTTQHSSLKKVYTKINQTDIKTVGAPRPTAFNRQHPVKRPGICNATFSTKNLRTNEICNAKNLDKSKFENTLEKEGTLSTTRTGNSKNKKSEAESQSPLPLAYQSFGKGELAHELSKIKPRQQTPITLNKINKIKVLSPSHISKEFSIRSEDENKSFIKLKKVQNITNAGLPLPSKPSSRSPQNQFKFPWENSITSTDNRRIDENEIYYSTCNNPEEASRSIKKSDSEQLLGKSRKNNNPLSRILANVNSTRRLPDRTLQPKALNQAEPSSFLERQKHIREIRRITTKEPLKMIAKSPSQKQRDCSQESFDQTQSEYFAGSMLCPEEKVTTQPRVPKLIFSANNPLAPFKRVSDRDRPKEYSENLIVKDENSRSSSRDRSGSCNSRKSLTNRFRKEELILKRIFNMKPDSMDEQSI